jgi:Protein of unknown function (DUF3750)
MRWRTTVVAPLLLLVLGPVGVSTGCAILERRGAGWWDARRDSSEQAPDPAKAPEAIVQVYAARAVGLRGALGVHSWIVVKPSRALAYTRYEVVGWGVDRGAPAVRVNRAGPDNYWFGSRPEKLADLRGRAVDALIVRIEDAVRQYPYPSTYRTWPGPNSNTFIAYIARAVPELRLDLPPTAVGKDYLPGGAMAAASPSGTGVQVSLFGVLGLLLGYEEGVELNLLGLTMGLDLNSPAFKLPGIGRLGIPQWPGPGRETGPPLPSRADAHGQGTMRR